jgi:cation diffusion facilitator family transporter
MVEVSIWSFIVMGVSIIIDVNRSRILYNAAKKHNSQALEADALHFSTDIWSSAVVIFGLVCVLVSKWVPTLSFLTEADAIAALGVAAIVVLVSFRLGFRTIHGLLDSAPDGMVERVIEAVQAVPGVINCHSVRVRYAGAHTFIDAHILADGFLSLADTHDLTEKAENAIHKVVDGADITIHPEPAPISAVE